MSGIRFGFSSSAHTVLLWYMYNTTSHDLEAGGSGGSTSQVAADTEAEFSAFMWLKLPTGVTYKQ